MKTLPTPMFLRICGECLRCNRCGQHYISVAERDAFDLARGYMPCPRCERELQRPKRRARAVSQLAGCALFAACVLAWMVAL